MAGTRIPNSAAPDSTASNSMAASYYATSAQSLYSDLWQDMRNFLDSYSQVSSRNQQHSTIRAPVSSLADFANSASKQNSLSYESNQYTFPKSTGVTHNFVNQINPGSETHQITLDNDSNIAPTIQFDLGSNLMNCSSQQSNLTDFSGPYSYSNNSSGIGGSMVQVQHANQTCFSNDSSLASTLWNLGNGFGCASSTQGNNLGTGNLGNDSTVDYTARWDVGSNLDSSGANQGSLANQMAPPPVPDEMRLRPYVSDPPKAVEHRIERALENRLYMIDKKLVGDPQSPTACDYQVLGATGNVYTVRLATIPSCTCPDPQHTCKHLLFIMLRVLKLPDHDPRIWQTALLSSEVRDLLQNTRIDPGVLANQQVRQRFQEISAQVAEVGSGNAELQNLQREVSGDCPVCFEKMANQDGSVQEELSFCKVCGNNVHKDCFKRWSLSRQDSGERVTCIFCRSLWVEDSSLKKRKADSEIASDGYVNLADYSTDHRAEDMTLDRLYPQVRPKYLREWRGGY